MDKTSFNQNKNIILINLDLTISRNVSPRIKELIHRISLNILTILIQSLLLNCKM